VVKAGAIGATDTPVDLTDELPLDDENVLAPRQPSFWRHYRWPTVGIAALLIAAAVGFPLWLTSGSSTPTGITVTTVTVPVTTGTMQQTIASSGTIEPASQANLNFAVSGTVSGVNVKAGQTVSAGQRLAILHPASPNLEMGWASGRGAQTLAAADRHQCACVDPGGWSSVEGRNFDALLVWLGAPGGYLTTIPPNQHMPRDWPRLPPRPAPMRDSAGRR